MISSSLSFYSCSSYSFSSYNYYNLLLIFLNPLIPLNLTLIHTPILIFFGFFVGGRSFVWFCFVYGGIFSGFWVVFLFCFGFFLFLFLGFFGGFSFLTTTISKMKLSLFWLSVPDSGTCYSKESEALCSTQASEGQALGAHLLQKLPAFAPHLLLHSAQRRSVCATSFSHSKGLIPLLWMLTYSQLSWASSLSPSWSQLDCTQGLLPLLWDNSWPAGVFLFERKALG